MRRSSKSVKSNIVEGYGRRNYKQDFIRFLHFALASNNETIDHIETLYETKSLTDTEKFNSLHERLNKLGKMIYSFVQTVKKEHLSEK